MKAIVKKEAKPGLWMENIPTPTPGDREVLIKTRKTSICGTDLHIYQWDAWAQKTIKVPMAIGHEFVGEIAKVGKLVEDLKPGQRVSGEGHVVCGHCSNCLKGLKHLCMHTKGLGVNRPGCFAEYFALPAENVFVLPPFVSDDVAAILDPFGNAVHTALSFNLCGEDLLITGAGPIGIMAAAIARQAGARHIVITDINDYRLELARKMGATVTVNINKASVEGAMKALNIQDGFPIGLEMSGNPKGLATLLDKVQHGGHIALLGIVPGTAIDWDKVIFKMLTIKGIYGREIFATWFKMMGLLESGLNLTPLITHQFDADEFEKGFKIVASGQSGKVILNWG